MSNMQITAVIPARAGSRRLPGKNIARFNGVPLLTRKIRQLMQAQMIDRVVVSSDSDDYLTMAAAEGAGTHKREPQYCDEVTEPFGAVIANVCRALDGDVIAWTPCTAPLFDAHQIDAALKAWLISDGYDSVVSVWEDRRYSMHQGIIDERKGFPENYNAGLDHVPSQGLAPRYIWSGGLWAAKRTDMVEWNYFHGVAPLLHVCPKRCGVDIDDELDMAQAEAWEPMA